MQAIALFIADDLFDRATRYARDHGMSLDALIQELLARAVGSGTGQAMKDLFKLMDEAKGNSAGQRWTRSKLHGV